MKSLFRASILGLGHSEVVVIRQHVAAILEGLNVDWVSATHEDLDFLIVNSNFISASSVQNLLRNNTMPVLLASHSATETANGQHSITLPLHDDTQLKKWINECVLNEQTPSSVHLVKPQESVITQVLLDNTKVFQYLGSANDGLLHLSDSCGAVGVIDTADQLVYLLPERKVPVDMQSHLMYERLPSLPKAYQSIDLMQWLWDVAWMSPSCSVLVAPDQLVKLKFWPQPSRTQDRKDVLLLSAKLAQKPTSAQELSTALKMPLQRVQHFMSALVMVGFGERHTVVETLQKEVVPEKTINHEEASGLRRLLMGVRRRLGL